MWMHTFLKSLTSTRRRKTRRNPPVSRPRLERLDDRCLPSFVGPVTYPADSIPPEPPGPVQDFNGDGQADFAYLGAGSVTVHLGNGDGTYQTGQTVPITGTDSWGGLGVGDFNGDKRLDIVASSVWYDSEGYSTDCLDVLLGRGDGTFAVSSTYVVGAEPFRTIAVVDLDANGRDDVVLGGAWGSFQVWVGNADGGMRQSGNVSTAFAVQSITAGELDGDGRPDIIVTDNFGLNVYLGNGDGTLRSAGTYASGGHSPGRPVIADFDRDGRPDLAVLNVGNWYNEPVTGRSLAILLGNGDGSFQAPLALIDGPDAEMRTVADVNVDGFPDVVVSVTGSDASVMVNAADWSAHPPAIAVGDVSLAEGNTGTRVATFRVTLDVPSGQAITVAYATADGTATAGNDYVATAGTLTFAPGETSKTVTVPVIGDRLGEANETFSLNVGSPTNAIIADGQGTATILDDEPRISIGDVTKTEGRSRKTTQFTFTVTLSAAYDEPVTMSFRTADGTATTGDNDYVAKTGTLTFAPGETTKTITISVKGDGKREATEYFYLDLSDNSGNSLFTKNRGIGTILNDD